MGERKIESSGREKAPHSTSQSCFQTPRKLAARTGRLGAIWDLRSFSKHHRAEPPRSECIPGIAHHSGTQALSSLDIVQLPHTGHVTVSLSFFSSYLPGLLGVHRSIHGEEVQCLQTALGTCSAWYTTRAFDTVSEESFLQRRRTLWSIIMCSEALCLGVRTQIHLH